MASTESTKTSKENEVLTDKVISIETSPTPENISRCNQQLQSPLFKILPAEIRNDIFSLALLQYEDLANPYPEHDFCYRPGHRARRIVSTDLLLTCRRIWLEANHWPMEQAVHSFWFDADRRPAWTKSEHNSGTFHDDRRFFDIVKNLTPLQKSRIKHIQVSAQMYWLERSIRFSKLWNRSAYDMPTLSTFTITIRHSDWWLWEEGEPLRIDATWLSDLLQSPEATHISEFRLELETLESHVNQLRPILESLKPAAEPSKNDIVPVRWEILEPFEESFWSGPTNVGGEEREIYSQRDKLDYHITTMKWKRREPAAEKMEQRWREDGSLLKLVDAPANLWDSQYHGCGTDDSLDHDYDLEYESSNGDDEVNDNDEDEDTSNVNDPESVDPESVDHNGEDHETRHEGLREEANADQHEEVPNHVTHHEHPHHDPENDDDE
jgi:hypothetical protein